VGGADWHTAEHYHNLHSTWLSVRDLIGSRNMLAVATTNKKKLAALRSGEGARSRLFNFARFHAQSKSQKFPALIKLKIMR
jgi:hypothetical protein